MMTTTLREPPISSCDRFRKQINKTNKGKSIVFQILFGVSTLFTKKSRSQVQGPQGSVVDDAAVSKLHVRYDAFLSTLIKRFGRFLPVSTVETTNYWQSAIGVNVIAQNNPDGICRLRHYVDPSCVALWAIIRGNTEIWKSSCVCAGTAVSREFISWWLCCFFVERRLERMRVS
jgi:hypothetical protein